MRIPTIPVVEEYKREESSFQSNTPYSPFPQCKVHSPLQYNPFKCGALLMALQIGLYSPRYR